MILVAACLTLTPAVVQTSTTAGVLLTRYDHRTLRLLEVIQAATNGVFRIEYTLCVQKASAVHGAYPGPLPQVNCQQQRWRC
jgi:hypothetical protein